MTAMRVMGRKSMTDMELCGGDTLLTSEVFTTISTVGNGLITAAAMVGGVVYRTGSTGAYTDTLDSAANILSALAGNDPAGPVVPGLSFQFQITNTVAFAETITLGAGILAGLGTLNVSASSVRNYLATINSVQTPVNVVGNTTNGSAVVTWTLPPGTTALQEGPAVTAVNIMPGASVSGAGIPAGATVLGVTAGQGGSVGITLSANATATGANVALSFGPTITLSTLGSGSL